MTTLLDIAFEPGTEPHWETIMADMNAQTSGTETGVKRYEYWKGRGAEPRLLPASRSTTNAPSIATRCRRTMKAMISRRCWKASGWKSRSGERRWRRTSADTRPGAAR